MFSALPSPIDGLNALDWQKFEPYYRELIGFSLSEATIDGWLRDWTMLRHHLDETYWRLYVATTTDTADLDNTTQYQSFLECIHPNSQAREQELKQKLLQSGLIPAGVEIPLQKIRAEAEIFCSANLSLLSQELSLATEYDKIYGAQTITWQGAEITLTQIKNILSNAERTQRETAWRAAAERQLADRQAINDLWRELLTTRMQIAANAGLPDYRTYRWQQLHRFDYTPQDSLLFDQAIKEVVVPAAQRIYARRCQRLGIDSPRPWDLDIDPLGRPPLQPFQTISELVEKTSAIFQAIDPELGQYFYIMREEGLLDLENRKDKAPGGYCTEFKITQRPFIFANSVGIHDDVVTLLHEGGHAFHVFETNALPYHLQTIIPMEFAEVASTSMELLGSKYLSQEPRGFYSEADARRAFVDQLERMILFWPYMGVVDSFQHWVYTHPSQALSPGNCDDVWSKLWRQFMGGENWEGLEQEVATGWQRKLHIIQNPFYYVEYGLAQVGAALVWRNALSNQADAIKCYRRALALGGTATLPDLFAAAGARFSFDARTLAEIVNLMEETIHDLDID